MTCVIYAFHILYCILLLHLCEAANILGVFSIPVISHQLVFRPVMHELAKRGHNVTVITTDPAFSKHETQANLKEIDVHEISYKIWKRCVMTINGDGNNLWQQGSTFIFVIQEIFEEQFKSVEVQNLVNDKNVKFDLIFLDHSSHLDLSYSYLYKVPVIAINSLGPMYDTFNSVDSVKHPIIYPMAPILKFHNINIWERIYQWYEHYMIEVGYNVYEKMNNKILKRIFGNDIPNISDLRKNIQLTLLNTYRILDNNRPVPPNIVYIGGVRLNQVNGLPKDLKLYLDESTEGVIYMSFGSITLPSLLSQDKVKVLAEVFSELPYNVLLKWDKDIPGCPSNVKIGKWFPQADLLKHKNIKLFITHGGYQSLTESIDAGIPLISIPMTADHWFNAELCLKHKIGIKLEFKSLTKEKLMYAIEEVIGNESYRINIMKLRNLTRDLPFSPLEHAIWWTEHVLRHGGAAHLHSAAAHVHWTEYYELNIILTLLVLIVSMYLTMVYCYKFIVTNYIHSGNKVKMD